MNTISHVTRCWAEVDLDAIRRNVAAVRAVVGPDTGILAVVKADAYGHGLAPVARALAGTGEVACFGVANVIEAEHLREVQPGVAVTVLSPALPEEREAVVRMGLLPWVSSVAEAMDYARLAEGLGRTPFAVEIKVDTGMGRMGVLEAGLPELRAAVEGSPALRLAGVATHLPSPDEDTAFTRKQLGVFEALATHLPPGAHQQAQSSAGLIGYPHGACNLVRPGLMLYGSSPLSEFQGWLRPALTLKTRVTLVRDLPAGWGVSYGRTFITPRPMRVGTLGAGYADGYQRHLSNAGAEVLVRGQRCPLLGRVTMDQIMIDLSALPKVEAGEEVVLLGQQGKEEILAAELAGKAGTIPWEIFTGLTARVGRYYVGG